MNSSFSAETRPENGSAQGSRSITNVSPLDPTPKSRTSPFSKVSSRGPSVASIRAPRTKKILLIRDNPTFTGISSNIDHRSFVPLIVADLLAQGRDPGPVRLRQDDHVTLADVEVVGPLAVLPLAHLV